MTSEFTIDSTINPLWIKVKQFTNSIDKYAALILTKLRLIDKVKIVLYVSWIWAWAGLYTTKLFESLFMAILYMPDSWLSIPIGKVENTNGQKIHILSAHTDAGEITNKLKLFLKLYWEKGGIDRSHDNNGIDYSNISKMLNCTMLYCSYLLTDQNGNVPPEVFWNNVHKFLVDQEVNTSNGKTSYYRSYKSDRSDRHKLIMRNLDFEGTAL
jgi:hypothetical protein